mmetsp:Transcript_21975/g.24329  ORF Transcript_21975/g.24329 Transcript_21975/m.24329 type:complete len:460 (-) Transcript_21975:166-1545(-)
MYTAATKLLWIGWILLFVNLSSTADRGSFLFFAADAFLLSSPPKISDNKISTVVARKRRGAPSYDCYEQPVFSPLHFSFGPSSSLREASSPTVLSSSMPRNATGPDTAAGADSSQADAVVERIFNLLDVDKSGMISMNELTNHLKLRDGFGYSDRDIQTVFSRIDADGSGGICREEFRRAMLGSGREDCPLSCLTTQKASADMIFMLVDKNGSGTIEMEELAEYLEGQYTGEEIEILFGKMDQNSDGEISMDEFRQAMMVQEQSPSPTPAQKPAILVEDFPRGYFLNSVKQAYVPLGPIGRISQQIETLRPFRRAYRLISTVFEMDHNAIQKLGVSFALSYNVLSSLNGALSFSAAWYISCKRTGLSPLVPGQWRSLLASYGMIYGLIQVLKPFRVAAAIGMSKMSAEYLEMTQTRFRCSRGTAIASQFMMSQLMMCLCASAGVTIVSLVTGVPILSGR